jgi:hypothetical protein
MGYFVNITNQEFFVSKDNFDAAYKAMCALNDRDDLKSGGSWGGNGITSDSPRPEGMTYHPAKWFSWMPANYPEVCKDFLSILKELGFQYDLDDSGNLALVHYDDKTGAEGHFFAAIAPFVQDGSFIEWRGEDGSEYRWVFTNGTCSEQTVVTKVWS